MKAKKINKGDTIAVVSLSSGVLGESFVSHEVELAKKRLDEYGFKLKFMPNSLKGIDYIKNNPQARANDLIEAFEDKEVKAIICAIGGDDTYRLSPFLFENNKLEDIIKKNPKIFLGFSDTTVNHFMLNKCGLNTFYGQALLTDVAELDVEMLDYTKQYFESLFLKGEIDKINGSPIWYEERKSFGVDQIGIPRIAHEDNKGFDVISGTGKFAGKILGGCIESIYEMLTGEVYSDQKNIIDKYKIFPDLSQWDGKILLLETSEEKASPNKVKTMLMKLKEYGLFNVVSGVLVGKPIDNVYYDEYKKIYLEVIDNPELSVVFNINIGHGIPRCIIPFGIAAEVDAQNGIFKFLEKILD